MCYLEEFFKIAMFCLLLWLVTQKTNVGVYNFYKEKLNTTKIPIHQGDSGVAEGGEIYLLISSFIYFKSKLIFITC